VSGYASTLPFIPTNGSIKNVCIRDHTRVTTKAEKKICQNISRFNGIFEARPKKCFDNVFRLPEKTHRKLIAYLVHFLFNVIHEKNNHWLINLLSMCLKGQS
jgi:hypothetical protein